MCLKSLNTFQITSPSTCAGGCVEWAKMVRSAALFTETFSQSISPATSFTTKPAARLEPPLSRDTSNKVFGAVLRNSRCGMVQGPKTPCNALLPRTSIIAVQHFPDHILRGRGRWKGHIKGFAAMPALALPRALVAIVKGCCNRAVLCMIAR